jgi:hypothetical protein
MSRKNPNPQRLGQLRMNDAAPGADSRYNSWSQGYQGSSSDANNMRQSYSNNNLFSNSNNTSTGRLGDYGYQGRSGRGGKLFKSKKRRSLKRRRNTRRRRN